MRYRRRRRFLAWTERGFRPLQFEAGITSDGSRTRATLGRRVSDLFSEGCRASMRFDKGVYLRRHQRDKHA